MRSCVFCFPCLRLLRPDNQDWHRVLYRNWRRRYFCGMLHYYCRVHAITKTKSVQWVSWSHVWYCFCHRTFARWACLRVLSFQQHPNLPRWSFYDQCILEMVFLQWENDGELVKVCHRLTWVLVNLPIGAIAFLVVLFCLPSSLGTSSSDLQTQTWGHIFKRFDPIGTALFIPSIICLLLALQWGGGQYPFSSPRVIVTLTIFCITFVIWILFQCFQSEETATIPRSVLNQRTVIGACAYTFFGSAGFSAIVYYLPIWWEPQYFCSQLQLIW